MAVYAAQVDRMDRAWSDPVGALRRNRRCSTTQLSFFLSDNGGCAEFLREDGECDPSLQPPTGDGRPMRLGNSPAIRPAARRHLHELRSALGQRLQHALPPVQALGPRGRHRHAPASSGPQAAAWGAIVTPISRRHHGRRVWTLAGLPIRRSLRGILIHADDGESLPRKSPY